MHSEMVNYKGYPAYNTPSQINKDHQRYHFNGIRFLCKPKIQKCRFIIKSKRLYDQRLQVYYTQVPFVCNATILLPPEKPKTDSAQTITTGSKRLQPPLTSAEAAHDARPSQEPQAPDKANDG